MYSDKAFFVNREFEFPILSESEFQNSVRYFVLQPFKSISILYHLKVYKLFFIYGPYRK